MKTKFQTIAQLTDAIARKRQVSDTLLAREMLQPSHPLHNMLLAWCRKRDVPMTKRQARKLLQRYPAYREPIQLIPLRADRERPLPVEFVP